MERRKTEHIKWTKLELNVSIKYQYGHEKYLDNLMQSLRKFVTE